MAQTFLTNPITADDKTFVVDDGSVFPAAIPFTMILDEEQVRILSRNGNTISDCIRSWDGTIAEVHDAGIAAVLAGLSPVGGGIDSINVVQKYAETIVGSVGDMTKATYDTNADGVINEAAIPVTTGLVWSIVFGG